MKLSGLPFLLASAIAFISVCSAQRNKGATPPAFKKCADIRILPAYDKKKHPILYGGSTYEDWTRKWWTWFFQFNNSAQAGGPDGLELQPKEAYLLTGRQRQTTAVRQVKAPKGKPIVIDLTSELNWYNPEETEHTELVTLYQTLGIDTSSLSNASRSVLGATQYLVADHTEISLTLEVDGCKLNAKQNGLIVTSPEHVFVLPVNEVFGSEPGNMYAAQAGYWAILPPFKKRGSHSIRLTQFINRTGPAAVLGFDTQTTDVTYLIDVM